MNRMALAIFLSTLAAVLVVAPSSSVGENRSSESKAKSRTFRFDYGASLEHLPEGASVRIWLPVPQTNEHQTIKVLPSNLPAKAMTAVEPIYGNKILYFEARGPASGELSFKTSYEVRRNEVLGLSESGGRTKLSDAERKRFLSANKKVPLTGKQHSLLEGVNLPDDSLAIARTLYNRVDQHVRYDKSRPGYGSGDVLWVCDSRFGNCTDFHSLFISLARANGLPGKFEIGFLLPSKRGEDAIGGYHCWALFHHERNGWVPVDISEADKHPEMKEYYFGNLTENRVTFTTGRDISLVPRQAGEPLNFFVYPYVEVNGKPLASDNMTKQFQFRDL